MGRRKIEIKKIENESARNICFSKRRRGLFKKANAFARDFGAAIAVFTCTPHGNAYLYGSPTAESVMRRFVLDHLDVKDHEEVGSNSSHDLGGNADAEADEDSERTDQDMKEEEEVVVKKDLEKEVLESERFWWNGAKMDWLTPAEAVKLKEDLLELKHKIQDRVARSSS